MPTNLIIDDALLNEAKHLGGHRTKSEAINAALREYVQRRKRIQSLKLIGRIKFDLGFDYKGAREER